MNHTPGPWIADGKTVRIGHGNLSGFSLASCSVPVDTGEAEANARLIAAAPELLKALKMVWESCDDELLQEFNWDAWYKETKTIIAKAEEKEG